MTTISTDIMVNGTTDGNEIPASHIRNELVGHYTDAQGNVHAIIPMTYATIWKFSNGGDINSAEWREYPSIPDGHNSDGTVKYKVWTKTEANKAENYRVIIPHFVAFPNKTKIGTITFKQYRDYIAAGNLPTRDFKGGFDATAFFEATSEEAKMTALLSILDAQLQYISQDTAVQAATEVIQSRITRVDTPTSQAVRTEPLLNDTSSSGEITREQKIELVKSIGINPFRAKDLVDNNFADITTPEMDKLSTLSPADFKALTGIDRS